MEYLECLIGRGALVNIRTVILRSHLSVIEGIARDVIKTKKDIENALITAYLHDSINVKFRLYIKFKKGEVYRYELDTEEQLSLDNLSNNELKTILLSQQEALIIKNFHLYC